MSLHVSSNVWRSCPQQSERLLLMLALADFANDEGYAWPSQASLAKRVRCSERGVQRMIDSLIEEGEFTLVKAGGGRGNSATYLLARYSEGGLLTDFRKGDPEAIKGDPEANKGRKRTVQSAAEPKRTIKNSQYSGHVVNIYEAYPKKVGRPAALKAIDRALRTTPAVELLERTQKYAEAVKDTNPQFIPHPTTWFNQERFNDDPKTWTRADRRDRTESNRNTGTANEGRSAQYRGVGKVLRLHRPERG